MAIVGARRASPYGIDVARALGRGLAAAGVTVVSGMALGIDSAAHHGALDAEGADDRRARRPRRAAVPGPRAASCTGGSAIAARSSPSSRPAPTTRRWMFPARNRLIAALSAMTVVVEGAPATRVL